MVPKVGCATSATPRGACLTAAQEEDSARRQSPRASKSHDRRIGHARHAFLREVDKSFWWCVSYRFLLRRRRRERKTSLVRSFRGRAAAAARSLVSRAPLTAEETESLSPAFERARAGVLLVAAQTVRRVNSSPLRALVSRRLPIRTNLNFCGFEDQNLLKMR